MKREATEKAKHGRLITGPAWNFFMRQKRNPATRDHSEGSRILLRKKWVWKWFFRKRKSDETQTSQRISLVGVWGFEPQASCSRSKRDTKLRHTPKWSICHTKLYYTQWENQCQGRSGKTIAKRGEVLYNKVITLQ